MIFKVFLHTRKTGLSRFIGHVKATDKADAMLAAHDYFPHNSREYIIVNVAADQFNAKKKLMAECQAAVEFERWLAMPAAKVKA